MSEYQNQKKTKPTIEERIGDLLAEPLKGELLCFVNFWKRTKVFSAVGVNEFL